MTIKIYNTLTNKKEVFQPKKEKFVSMYVCGVTPYAEMHLGHARAYVVFDVIKRHLKKRGYEVKHIQNFTDVDDKIIKRSQEKNVSPSELAEKYIRDYKCQAGKLNILEADNYPRVTQMIKKIVCFIAELVNKGFAYESNGNVYFSVKKFKDYGKLSKRSLTDLKIATRVDVSNDKKSAFDFVLWKKMKESEPQEVIWESPWGKGRPGWHIECSVMSYELLGEIIDIHGGGQDLIFPHHENEIAQSEGRSGKQFVKYWIHNGFVTINKEKMSKSLNNSFSLMAIFEKYDPRIIRYYLLTQDYSGPLDFSEECLKNTKNALQGDHGIDEYYLKLVDLLEESVIEITDKDLLYYVKKTVKKIIDKYILDSVKKLVKEITDKDKDLFNFIKKFLKEIIDKDKDLLDYVNESVNGITDKDLLALQKNFLGSLDDNFNFPKALSYLHKLKNIELKCEVKRLFQLKTLFEDFTETSLGIVLCKRKKDGFENTKKTLQKIIDEFYLKLIDHVKRFVNGMTDKDFVEISLGIADLPKE